MPSVLPFPRRVADLLLLLKKNGVSQKVYNMTMMHARETGLRAFFPAEMAYIAAIVVGHLVWITPPSC